MISIFYCHWWSLFLQAALVAIGFACFVAGMWLVSSSIDASNKRSILAYFLGSGGVLTLVYSAICFIKWILFMAKV